MHEGGRGEKHEYACRRQQSVYQVVLMKKALVLKLCTETLNTVKIVNFTLIHCVEGKEDNL